MSLNDVMKNHMDAVRDVTGASGLLSMAMATDALKNLNAFEGKALPYDTDFNELDKPGVYSAWLKPMKNAPLNGSDQGSIVLIFKQETSVLQMIFSFYSGLYYRVDSMAQIKAGKIAWNKVGGVAKAFLAALTPVRGCVA